MRAAVIDPMEVVIDGAGAKQSLTNAVESVFYFHIASIATLMINDKIPRTRAKVKSGLSIFLRKPKER